LGGQYNDRANYGQGHLLFKGIKNGVNYHRPVINSTENRKINQTLAIQGNKNSIDKPVVWLKIK
jgi:hypothetical protein